MNTENDKFLDKVGKWTINYTEAKHFTTRDEAVITSWTIKGGMRVMSLEMARHLQGRL